MAKKEIEISDKAKKITIWLASMVFLFMTGLVLLFTSDYKNYKHDDFVEIEIVFERINITNVGDGEYMYSIFPQNVEKSFLINNVVSNLFKKQYFDNQILKDDLVTLTVLKSKYESSDYRVDTLGVKKNNNVYLDFETAYTKLKENDKISYIISIVLLSTGSILIIAFTIWVLHNNKKTVTK